MKEQDFDEEAVVREIDEMLQEPIAERTDTYHVIVPGQLAFTIATHLHVRIGATKKIADLGKAFFQEQGVTSPPEELDRHNPESLSSLIYEQIASQIPIRIDEDGERMRVRIPQTLPETASLTLTTRGMDFLNEEIARSMQSPFGIDELLTSGRLQPVTQDHLYRDKRFLAALPIITRGVGYFLAFNIACIRAGAPTRPTFQDFLGTISKF